MKTVQGYHGEWNMGSPGGWDYQRIAQHLGQKAWDNIRSLVDPGVEFDLSDPRINPIPGFIRMLLRAHEAMHGRNPVHAVILAESETLDTVLENKNFVGHLNGIDGVKGSLAGPEHLSLKNGKVMCRGEEASIIFMDFNSDTLVNIGQNQDIAPIEQAIEQGILVNPRGMEPLGAKGVFEAVGDQFKSQLSQTTTEKTPWTRQFYSRKTTGPRGETIDDLPGWTKENWADLVLKPAHGYSGHGIFVGHQEADPLACINKALDTGDYIVQQLVPLSVWTERSAWPASQSGSVGLEEWQTDFRCFITHEGLQGFLARFGGIPTNVGSGGGIQPLALLKSPMDYRVAVDKINDALVRIGYAAYTQIQAEIDKEAEQLGFTYLLGPIKMLLRPRLLTEEHMADLKAYSENLWKDSVKLEQIWRDGGLDNLVRIGERERDLALKQPWNGGPALMVSDGLFSFGAGLEPERE